MRSVVLLSGGIDSTVALALAMRSSSTVHCLSFEYGQRHDKETTAAKKIANHYACPWREAHAPVFPGDSTLMNPQMHMPHMTYEELSEAEGPSPTYVPFRNGTFMSVAAGYALQIGADDIYCGMHAEDAHNWAYPDCTPEFIGAMQNAIYVGTYHKVRLVAPLTYMSKAEVVSRGLLEEVPFHLTWSCYEGRRRACGKCPTCIGRLEAFRKNGAKDPIEYEVTSG